MNWVHAPVPKERDDETYFAPLKGLTVGEATRLVLGLCILTTGRERDGGLERRNRLLRRFSVGRSWMVFSGFLIDDGGH